MIVKMIVKKIVKMIMLSPIVGDSYNQLSHRYLCTDHSRKSSSFQWKLKLGNEHSDVPKMWWDISYSVTTYMFLHVVKISDLRVRVRTLSKQCLGRRSNHVHTVLLFSYGKFTTHILAIKNVQFGIFALRKTTK